MRHHFLRLLAATLAILAFDVSCRAQPGDVPPIAQHEISRRGAHVEHTGTIRSGLMALALSPPADDSAKWFVTLIVKPGDPASEKMRSMLANDPAIRPWIDVRDPAKSTTHFHVRSVDDPTQADWLQGLRPAIQRSGIPLIVLQPPKSGQFGPSSTIVKLVAGVVTGDQLATKLREGIIAYIQETEPRGIGVAPPFNVAPKDPVQPMVPFDWPPAPPQVDPQVPANPTTPVPSLPTTSLALLIGTFVAGWISAHARTLVRKLSGIATAIQDLNDLKKNVSALKDHQDPKDE